MSKNTATKILIVTPLYPPQIGGPATIAVFLERVLPEQGFAVSLAKFGSYLWLPAGVRHVAFLCSLLWRVWRADTVLVLDPVSVGYPAMWACRILRKPYVLRVPGDYAWEQGVAHHGVTDLLDDFVQTEKTAYPKKVQRLHKLQSLVAKHAVKVIAQNQYLKWVIESWGVNEEKIVTITNPFTPPTTSDIKETARAALDMPTDAAVILTAGRLVSWKGFAAVITSFATVSPETARLYIVGEGPEETSLRQLATECGVGDRVYFVGSLPKDQLHQYIVAADGFILNTAYEGVSNQLLEVMALGTPIATTLAAGNRELIQNTEHAIVFLYNNEQEIRGAFDSFFYHQHMLLGLAASAKKQLVFYDPETVAVQYKELLSTIQ